ncbi:serpin family protein [Nakamurella alba]|uniref:serpin family protein n=1 Tax=Nakamurella alba TaxID=2665158 RepID=UPI0018A8E0B5|nr:serpin family protein [Nakamurella alba]
MPLAAPVELKGDGKRVAPASAAVASEALTGFGLDLLGALEPDENAVISPYSVYAVLAMARVGAKGETAAQLDQLLGADPDVQGAVVTAVDAAVKAAIAAGAMIPTSPDAPPNRPLEFGNGNSIWVQPGLPVEQDFLDGVRQGFDSAVYELDFEGDPEASRLTINDWVADRTRDLIPELIPEGAITVDTLMALVNAVYLSAPWMEPLEETGDLSFTTPTGAVTVEGMRTPLTVSGAAGKGWRSATVPYLGAGLGMTLIVPDDGIAGFREQLPEVLPVATRAGGGGIPVDLTFPAFDAASKLSLVEHVRSLGYDHIFTPDTADWTGIADITPPLEAYELVHQAVITVDKDGTEAAAATAMLMMASSAPPPPETLVIDRPFFFVVHDTTTGAPLFLGQITDPTA